ncbi:hypothetical protein AB0D04_22780 [Streptomyces sp. NPDC048483]|uniref:hypothetical protein n=1 Tax=Streptomyces sp. NPDC048483 TaxID=3154927 RepID=UPI0034357BF9
MDASMSSLIVAVVGVLGTLVSGLLAHRGALRSKTLELRHAAQERRDERRAQERRELTETRRASYANLNQSLRHFHAALFRRYQDLAAGQADGDACGQPPPEVDDARQALRDVYAEAQMVASDEVLKTGGGVVHLLSRIQRMLDPLRREQGARETLLEEARDGLERASEGLYEVRQTMRKDLGITELPIARPDGYGVPRAHGNGRSPA